MNDTYKDAKDFLYESVIKDSDCCYKLAKKLLRAKQEVPLELIDGIAQDVFNTQWFCENWIFEKKQLPPEKLIDIILKTDDYLHIFKLFFSFINEWKMCDKENRLILCPNKKIINKCIEMLEKLLDTSNCEV